MADGAKEHASSASSGAMSRSNDAISMILEAPNHFECLRLPEPTLDLLGRPVWEVSVDEISKAYRKLARFCHPDKVGSMSEQDAARAEKAYEALRKAKECLSKDDTRGPYVREHCQFLKPDTKALEITSTDFTSSADRVKELERERRKEMQSIRTSESQELGNTVAQEMEKKRKLAELKRLQARSKAAQRAADVGSSDDSEDEELAKLKAKAPMVVKKQDDDEDAEEEARKKRQRQAAQRRRGGRMGI